MERHRFRLILGLLAGLVSIPGAYAASADMPTDTLTLSDDGTPIHTVQLGIDAHYGPWWAWSGGQVPAESLLPSACGGYIDSEHPSLLMQVEARPATDAVLRFSPVGQTSPDADVPMVIVEDPAGRLWCGADPQPILVMAQLGTYRIWVASSGVLPRAENGNIEMTVEDPAPQGGQGSLFSNFTSPGAPGGGFDIAPGSSVGSQGSVGQPILVPGGSGSAAPTTIPAPPGVAPRAPAAGPAAPQG